MPRPVSRQLARPVSQTTHAAFARLPRKARLARGFRSPREMEALFVAKRISKALSKSPSRCAAKRALKNAALRDCGRRCVYCAAPLAPDSATIDHVYPRAKGGPHVAGNVVAACGTCNRKKADMLPNEFFLRYPEAGLNFVRYARTAHRALKRGARRAVSLAYAA